MERVPILYISVYIYQLFFTRETQVVHPFYVAKKGGEDVQTLVPLAAAAFYCIIQNLWHLKPTGEQQLIYTL
jgi:hypothetical protein